MSSRLPRILANLLRVVPEPPKPIARPTASFAGLKVGQRISTPSDHFGQLVYEVAATDSQGADLRAIEPWGGAADFGRRLEDRNWKSSWKRVRAPRKRTITVQVKENE